MIVPPYLQTNDDDSQKQTIREFQIDKVLDLKVVSSIHDFASEFIQIESYYVISYEGTVLKI